ncbi:hypothetical protein PCC7418_0719 [Halothece sp. PCC 7418]|uniref:DUF6761 family protein n=1 Tax=Halothece sp. (strain PCC 7418) TaxID=65093 RepID=UPI0002A07DB9|nr:DUF6761 family protein [Halothece sp. PCC 7418]AFZ42939.1 hypothetical protein PCC7418_0719 [Halothece sp. PCC 7418]
MLQDSTAVRYYQHLTDAMVDYWHRGYRFNELRLYVDGYLAGLRSANVLEPYQLNRLEEEALRFLRDRSNFEAVLPEPDFY